MANAAANLAGLLVVEILDMVLLNPTSIIAVPALRVVWPVFIAISFTLVSCGHLIYEFPIRQAFRGMLMGRPLSPTMLAKARRRVLNEPLVVVLIDLAVWCAAAVVFSQAVRSAPGGQFLGPMIALRALLIGSVTVSAAYFLIDHLIQHRLGVIIFPQGGLSRVRGVLRGRLAVRLIALIFATVIVPFGAILLTILGSSRILRMGVRPPEEILQRLQTVVAAEALIFLITACALTGLVAVGLSIQLKQIIRALHRVAKGDFSHKVVVTSNDEMGYTGDAINDMIQGLKERDLIKETFGRYVSQQVRDEILRGAIPLDGEHKEVTVLFADLRNFTPLVESTPPKLVVSIINGYFQEMAEAIDQEGGLVLQFIGDEIEAVFGAPLPLEDHPRRAVRAALEMRRRLAKVNAQLAGQGLPPLEHGVGIHSGQVVAANIGSPERLSYALVGDTVNLASRIQGLTKGLGADILISGRTRAALGQEFSLRDLPATPVKGKRDQVEIWAVA